MHVQPMGSVGVASKGRGAGGVAGRPQAEAPRAANQPARPDGTSVLISYVRRMEATSSYPGRKKST